MAKPRIQVSTQIQAPGFRPAAAPVDSFTRPRGGQKLAQVARGLSALAPGLARYAEVTQAVDEEKALQDAERQALEDIDRLRAAETTYREAREEGLIQEHQDPIYRARYQELWGRNLAETALSEWQVRKGEVLSDATTLEEYDQAFNDFYEEHTSETLGESRNDPALAAAYRQTVQRGLAADKRNFSAQAGARMSQMADERFFSSLFRGTMRRVTEGMGTDDLAQFVSDSLEEHQGMNGTSPGARRRNNQLAMRAVLEAAETAAMTSDIPGEPLAILEALRQVPTGDGATLGTSSWAQDMVDQAEAEILQNMGLRDQMAARANNARLDEIVTNATNRVFEDPTAPLKDVFQQINDLGLDQQTAQATIRSLETTRRTMLGNQNETDPSVLRDLQVAIQADPSGGRRHQMEVTMALQAGELSTGDAQNLYSMAQTYASAMGSGGVFDDDTYDRMFSDFTRLFPSDMMGSMTGMDALKRQQASAEYNRAWRQFATENPDATVDQKETFLLRLSERLAGPDGYDLFDSFGADVPRDPRLGPNPAWNSTKVMGSETFGALDAVYNNDAPFSAFPARAQEGIMALLANQGLNPMTNADLIRDLLEAQRPFFDPNSDPLNPS